MQGQWGPAKWEPSLEVPWHDPSLAEITYLLLQMANPCPERLRSLLEAEVKLDTHVFRHQDWSLSHQQQWAEGS